MNKLSSIFFATACSMSTFIAQAAEVKFEISGINSDNGKLYVQLFKGLENYQQGKAASATIVQAKQGNAVVSFSNIEPGDYALRFFHDENDNGQLETNLLGMPVEGYGFSNNAKPNFGPVSYEQISFAVNQDDVVNKTQVIY